MTGLGSKLQRRLAVWLPVAAIFSAMLAVNLWVHDEPARVDLTTGDVFSISPATLRVIETLKEPVRITYFFDIRNKTFTDAMALLVQYAALSDLITVEGFDPALQPAEAARHQVRFVGAAIFESGDRRIAVSGLTEVEFTNGLIRASRQAAQQLCFTAGHNESDPFSLQSHDHFEGSMGAGHSHSTGGRPLLLHERHGMGMARNALEALGYKLKSIQLVKGPGQLDGCSVVILASPQQAYIAPETSQLVDYMNAGGRALLLLDPYIANGLEPILDLFGIVNDGYPVVDPTSHYWTDPGTPAISSYARHKITRNLALTFFPGATALRPRAAGIPDDVRVRPLIETSRDARVDAPDREAEISRGRRRHPMVLEATKRLGEGREASAVIIADGDFATNSFFHLLGNGQLFLNAVSLLAEQEALIDIQPRNYAMPKITLSNGQMIFTFAFSAILLPVLVLLTGFVVWRRKR